MNEPIGELDNTCGHTGCTNAGTYTLDGSCANCKRLYRVKCTKGHDAPGFMLGALCPHCGCRRVGCA